MTIRIYKSSWIIIFIGLIISQSCLVAGSEDYKRPQTIVGVKIYNYNKPLADLFLEWKELGINTVFTSVDLCSKNNFRELAKDHHISVFLILPIFYNPDTLQSNPELYAITNFGKTAKDKWVEFVCPSRESYREQKTIEIKKIVQKLNPDGISLDFIRHFVFWEKVYPEISIDSLPNTCFDRSCLEKFQKDTGIQIPEYLSSPETVFSWINKNHLEAWTDWKCNLITSMIQQIVVETKAVKPDLLVNVHAVPWRHDDFGGAIRIITGQDFWSISKIVNMISPMTYAHMVKREPAWIHDVVNDISKQSECRILPSIQVGRAYLNDELSNEEFEESLTEALKIPSAGVVFWSWEALDKEPFKKEIVRKMCINE